ncbi:Os05g0380200, partial [Oryza sativa Japonica Group]
VTTLIYHEASSIVSCHALFACPVIHAFGPLVPVWRNNIWRSRDSEFFSMSHIHDLPKQINPWSALGLPPLYCYVSFLISWF